MSSKSVDVMGLRLRTFRMRDEWTFREARRNGLPRVDFARGRGSVAVRIGRRVFSAYLRT